MSLFQFLRPDVGNVMSGIMQQKGITDNVMQTLKSYPGIVKQTWIGGDADEFEADVMRKVIPACVELIAAIAGCNLNLTKATEIVDNADKAAQGIANNLGDVFGRI
ncbi:MAG: hypothetical protein K1X39_10525 [Thermoflexales bacterium]|nr:hypothetical protein [Thermoflexales bacterium]